MLFYLIIAFVFYYIWYSKRLPKSKVDVRNLFDKILMHSNILFC